MSIGLPLTSMLDSIRDGRHMNELEEKCQVNNYDGEDMGLLSARMWGNRKER